MIILLTRLLASLNRHKWGHGQSRLGTSGGAAYDMLKEILWEAKNDVFVIDKMDADKDSSVHAIFCPHFLEDMLVYCSNHC